MHLSYSPHEDKRRAKHDEECGSSKLYVGSSQADKLPPVTPAMKRTKTATSGKMNATLYPASIENAQPLLVGKISKVGEVTLRKI